MQICANLTSYSVGATFVGWASFEGRSALLLAAEEGHIECVEMLLQHGADPNQVDSMEASPLLAGITQCGIVDIYIYMYFFYLISFLRASSHTILTYLYHLLPPPRF